ncbi:helix-turn-helix domain-containing protein [Streptomyces sp. CA-210063]|uniref:helix-turn-helix domain-containing protein n=1 Tax=Streptomyces sp. CA-210063 TaxID=2801029 RepID=UPI00214CBE6E|nr:helix-turn-helix transcriptional regulator [Streptomyces sp. CA-210063]UUU32151.1 helix-turn-helix domain-containing protein [Streptomyces sp. CA-210063]
MAGQPTVRSRRLGATLKKYRLAAKLDQPQVAEVIANHQARVSRIESGHVIARPIEIRVMLAAYGVDDPEVCGRLEKLAKEANRRGWWHEYAEHLRPDYVDHITLEADATYFQSWHPTLVAGLLQTASYAEAVMRSGPLEIAPEQADLLVRVRMRRQATVAEGGTPCEFVIWEPVVVHPLSSTEVHREQLSALLDAGQRENVTVRILPFGAAVLAGTSSFTSLGFGSEPIPEAVTVEHLGGTLVLEEPDDVAPYSHAFDLLRSAAMTPDESARFIRNALRSVDGN